MSIYEILIKIEHSGQYYIRYTKYFEGEKTAEGCEIELKGRNRYGLTYLKYKINSNKLTNF
jgi:hypothetical protein